jgi:DNA repair exonuclease SbcCD nuclease subunit
MAKILLFSDLHIYKHKKKTERLDDCLKVLDWVFQIAIERKIQSIIFAGDLFHNRHDIEIYTYHKTFEIFKKYLQSSSLCVYVLLGNHDLWYSQKWNVNSVYPLSAFSNVKIIDKPQKIKIEDSYFDFIPFTKDPISAIPEDVAPFLIGHIAVSGAKLHKNMYSDAIIEHDGDMSIVDSKIFKNYEQVFLGHYHSAQQINNVEYIGSSLELNFGDAYQEKHIIVFDTQTKEKEYIENTFSPKHIIVKEKDLKKHDLENNFVQILVDDISSVDIIELQKDLSKNNKLGSLEFKQDKKYEEKRLIEEVKNIFLNEEEMLERYVGEVDTSLNKEKLLKIGKEIINGSNFNLGE